MLVGNSNTCTLIIESNIINASFSYRMLYFIFIIILKKVFVVTVNYFTFAHALKNASKWWL
jgi:hypothetical protein